MMPDKKKKERDILLAADEFKPRMRKERTTSGLVGFLCRLGIPAETLTSAGFKSLGADLVASKAGFTALLFVGYTAAVGTGIVFNMSGSERRVRLGSQVFDRARVADEAVRAAQAESEGGASDEAVPAGSGSLDFFNRANKGSLNASNNGEPVGKGGEGEATEVGSGVGVPDNDWSAVAGTAKRGPVKAAPHPRLTLQSGIKSQSGGSTSASVTAGAGVAGGVRRTGTFSKGGMSSGHGGEAHVGSRVSSGARGGKTQAASIQALQVRKTLKNSLGQGTLTSARAGRPYDGGRGNANTIEGASVSLGGKGAGNAGDGKPSIVNASTADNLKVIEPPPRHKWPENKTPYQKLVNMGMLALAGATALMFMAGWLKNKADALAVTDPTAYARMLTNVKIVAGLATMAAMASAAVGVKLMSAEGQNMQGMTFVTGGGIIALRASMILYDSFSHKKGAEELKSATAGAISQQNMLKPDKDRFQYGGMFQG